MKRFFRCSLALCFALCILPQASGSNPWRSLDSSPDSRFILTIDPDEYDTLDFFIQGELEIDESLGSVWVVQLTGPDGDEVGDPIEPEFTYEEPGYWCAGISVAEAGYYRVYAAPYGGDAVTTVIQVGQ